MGTMFWIRRFVAGLVIAFIVIAGGQLLRQRELGHALFEAAVWAPVAAAIFVAVAIVRWRRASACALCDVPQAHAAQGAARGEPRA